MMPTTTITYVVNAIPHLVEINQVVLPNHVDPQYSFTCVILPMRMECLQTFFTQHFFFGHMNHYASIFIDSPYSIIDIPSVGRPYVPSVIGYLRAMLFNGDVLFELPPIINFDNHFGQMQGIDKKHDGHAWCKVKTINIKNDFNYNF